MEENMTFDEVIRNFIYSVETDKAKGKCKMVQLKS